MSSRALAESTRRRLSPRQADTVRRLTEAAMAELREVGYGALTVRNVAARGGIAAATAYTYFSSKNHLISELFWRRLLDLPEVPADGDVAERVVTVLRDIALVVADEPELAAACTPAMLGEDPDATHLRERIGQEWHRRIAAALGDGADPAVLNALEILLVGTFIHVGLGYSSYARTADQLEQSARLILECRS